MPRHGWGKQGQGKGNQQGGRGCEFRMTSSREAILSIIKKQSRHLTADEIFLIAKQTTPQIGLATVYRTLELLTQAAVIKRLDFGTGTSSYEINKEADSGFRNYAVCKSCGSIINCDFELNEKNELISPLSKKIHDKYKFEIDQNHIQFYGICMKCK